eukprot:TRINITY_DN76802_c0_g1_i1.p1 TRINITY_DN76802_c0_g1~~TRINITY_DN76802_c0_g1_i1.p1  ORF type:complete len:883 (+),score=137.12 TRINITY_DN76802_c0_g1_i1:35-2650(+)
MHIFLQLLGILSFLARAEQQASCPTNPAPLHEAWGCPPEHFSDELLLEPHLRTPADWSTWAFREGGASFAFSDTGVLIQTVEDNDNTPWHVQVKQPVVLEQDAEDGFYYSLCVQASASEAGMIQFAVDADGALNFAIAGGGVPSQLTLPEDGGLRARCFNFKLGPAATKYTGRVVLDLGGATGNINVCQASLRRCAVRPQVIGGLNPIRRCHLAPLEEGPGCEELTTRESSEFGLNEFGQETSGKVACLDHMRSNKGNTFVFSTGHCEVWKCDSRSALLQSSTGMQKNKDVFSEFCEYDEPVGGPQGRERRSPVYVQLWEWNYDDIAKECEAYLGPNGFSGVQISPVTEHILGSAWFTKYQPVGFQLNSRSGSKEQLVNMVATCRRAGVQIIVDVVLNHIAAPCQEALWAGSDQVMPCKGWAGSAFGNRRINSQYGWRGPEQFHHVFGNKMGNCPVDEETWTCPLSEPPGDCSLCDFKGLPDWNTGLQSVRDTLIKHLQELYSIGVTMIRIDAASYMNPDDLAAIVNTIPWDLVYQEWWGGVPEEKRSSFVGHYRDQAYGLKITQALAVGDAKYMADMLNITYGLDGIPPERAIYPLTFHDQRTLEADRFVPTYKNGLEFHQQQKFLLAWPQGNGVRLFGGYTWTDLDEGPPGKCGNGRCLPMPVYLFDNTEPRCMPTPAKSPLPQDELYRGWVCEHRWEGIAGLINFRKACRGLPVTQTWSEATSPGVERGQFGFRAGDSCFAAIVRGNNENFENYWGRLNDWRLAGLQTGLPAGRYCDLASLTTQRCWDRRRCPREVVIGDDGLVLTGFVRPGDLLAIHVGARLDNSTGSDDCSDVKVEDVQTSYAVSARTIIIVQSFMLFLLSEKMAQ